MEYRNKRTERYTIITFDGANLIKAVAKVKNESLYVEIKDLGLIAKEFKEHKHFSQHFAHRDKKGVRNEEQPST